MKRFFWAVILLIIFFGNNLGFVHAAEERIVDYQVGIDIHTDGTFAVTEGILYDFGDLDRHGIFRTIPYIKTNEEGKKFALALDDISVLDERSEPHQFVKSTQGDTIQLKIGDPNRTITGQHLYDIGYKVAGGLTYFSDHDELYWDAIGTEWQVPIGEASVRVILPSPVSKEDLQVLCFVGLEGETDQDCTSTIVDERTIEISTDRPLSSYEGMSVVVGFPKGITAVLEPTQVDAYKETWWWKLLVVSFVCIMITAATLWYVVTPLYIIYKWYRYGRDPKAAIGVARAWYSPPTGRGGRPLTPGETGTILDEQAGMHEVVATIINLAHRGYLTIEERKAHDFYLHKKNTSTHELQPHEQTLMKDVFEGSDSVHVAKAAWVGPVTAMKKQLYEAVVREGFFEQNPETMRAKYYILGVLAMMTANLPLAASAFIFGTVMPRKTPEGAQAAAIARSLRNFLTSQEKKLAFQAKHKMLFEKLLPYATAFGVEQVWAKRFDYLRVPSPDWYQGQSSARFSTYAFTHSLHTSFATSVAHAATPISSSSGFSSGSSGGSSGGGGGGGGGGSW